MSAGDWAILGTVVLAHALAVASPGPDFAMVTRRSLAFGRASGLWTAAGIGCGIVFHVAYGLFGIAWLGAHAPGFVRGLGLAGAAFLAVTGLQALRAKPLPPEAEAPGGAAPTRARSDFAIGLATNVLNPKAVLFFVALFSVVVAGAESTLVKVLMGVWLPLATFGWFALVAVLLSRARLRARLRAVAHWIDRGMGVALLGLAAGLAAHVAGGG